jgi:Flp pilus assembly pilin Flp
MRIAGNVRRAAARESGQGMTEYIVIVGLVAIAAIGVVTVFGDNVRALFGAAAGGLAGQQIELETRSVDKTDDNATLEDFNAHVQGK